MKRLNIRLLLALIAIGVMGVVTLGGVWQLQRWRNAGNLVTLAREARDDNRPLEAITLLQRYLIIRPDDNAAVAELADLTLKQSSVGDLSRQDLLQAYDLAESAVRRNPDNDALRGRVARFQMLAGQPADAREHLDFLAAKHPLPATGDDAASLPEWGPEDFTHPFSIQLMLIGCLSAVGEFEDAAARAATLVGFDLEKRTFDEAHNWDVPTDGFTLLAALLRDKLGDEEAADRVIEKLIETQGDKPEAWLALSNWHRTHDNLHAAGTAIDRALEIAPENKVALFALLELLIAKRDMPKAFDAANRCRELFPHEEGSYRLMATIHFEQGRAAEAEKVIREGLARVPGRPTLLLMLAEACLMQQDSAGAGLAIESLREVLEPANPMLLLMEGQRLMMERQWLPAKKLLEQARPRLNNNPDILHKIDFHLGRCYEQLGEHDAQLAAHQRVLTMAPTAIEPRVSAAAAMAAGGRYAEALKEFEAIAAILPPERVAAIPQIWHPLLQLRVAVQRQRPREKRDWSQIDGLIDALRATPSVNATQLAMLRADVLENKGETTAAVEVLERAVASDPKTPQLWMSLASIMLRDRGAAAARGVLDRVPEASRGDAGMLLVEASVAIAEGPEATDRSFRRVEELAGPLSDDDAARVLTTLARMRESTGNADEAERLWRGAIMRTPDDLRLHTSRFEAALEAGDKSRAEESLREIERIGGDQTARSRFGRAAIKVMDVRAALEKRQRDTERAASLSAEETTTLAEAQALLIDAENERPGWNRLQVLFAEIAGLKNDLPAAIERIRRAMQLGSVNPRVVKHLVAVLYGLNRIEEAQQVLAELGTEATAGFERLSAEMELQSGRLEEAVALAERSVSKDSRNPQELLWLGQLLDRAGRREQAGRWYEKAVEFGPERVETWIALLGYQISNNARKAAEVTFDRAAAALADPKRTICLAQGSEMLGRHEDAARYYRESVAAAPDDVEVKRNLAAFMLRRGQVAQVREPLQQIIDLAADGEPTKVWARRTLAELLAQNANFQTLQRAVAMIGANVDASGRLPPEDMALQVKLLSRRREPVCWKQAIDLIREIADLRPLTMAEQLTLAELHEKTGRWDDARSGLISICSAPNVPPAFVAMLVEKLVDHDEISEAVTWLRQLQNRLPDSPATHALAARIALTQNDRQTAVASGRHLLAAAAADGIPLDKMIGLASLLEELGFAKAADRIVSQMPADSPETILVKAEFLGNQKRPDEALQLLEKHWSDLPLERLLQTGFKVVRTQEDPGAHAARLGDWLTKARREDPGSVVLGMMLAELHDIEGRHEDVEKIYRELLAADGVPPQLRAIVANNLAYHLAIPATAKEALRLVDSAIEELGPQTDLLDTRGIANLAAGATAQALEDLRTATLEPTATKLLHLACAELESGDADAARRTLEAARKKQISPTRLSKADRERLERLSVALAEGTEA